MACTLKRVLYSVFTCTALLANAKPTDRLQWNLELGFCISSRPNLTVAERNFKVGNSNLNVYRAIFNWHLLPVTSCRLVYGINTGWHKKRELLKCVVAAMYSWQHCRTGTLNYVIFRHWQFGLLSLKRQVILVINGSISVNKFFNFCWVFQKFPFFVSPCICQKPTVHSK